MLVWTENLVTDSSSGFMEYWGDQKLAKILQLLELHKQASLSNITYINWGENLNMAKRAA